MIYRIPKSIIENFASDLLREVDIPQEVIDNNLNQFIYESGGKSWNETENNDGDEMYLIDDDD